MRAAWAAALLLWALPAKETAASAAEAETGAVYDGEGDKRGRSLLESAKAGAPVPAVTDVSGFDDLFWITVRADSSAARTKAATLGFSIDSVSDGAVGGVANSGLMGRLKKAGFVISEIKRLDALAKDFPAQDGAFHNAGEVEGQLQSIAGADPALLKSFSIGSSLQGRPLTAVRFFKDDGREKPGIAFIGTHHAREHLSTEVPLLIARWLADNRRRPEVGKLLEERDVYFIPLVNPDGVEHDIVDGRYKWHRKNMRENADGSFGVDLNRNYAFRFGGEGASDHPDSDTYHGPSAFSEPETQAVRDFLSSRANITTVVSYHTFSELIMYPWGGAREPITDKRALGAYKAMAQEMSQMTGYRPMQSSELYVATGDTCDWVWAELTKFCFTFELTPKTMGQGGFYPGAGAIQSAFQKNLDAALYLIEMADDPYRAGDAPAAAAGKPAKPKDKAWSKG